MYNHGLVFKTKSYLLLHDADPFDLRYIDAANIFETGDKRVLSMHR